jgi:hypothetical protein
MKNVVYNIEDCLELLVGLKGQGSFQIESSDQTFLQSIGRQTLKGTGLTDRQYIAVKEKIEKYQDQFSALEYNIDLSFENLRLPLRQIDRSRWIKIIERKDQLWIGVRFIFQKKLISKLEDLKRVSSESEYDAENKVHYFLFNESNAYKVVSIFIDAGFEIQQELLEYYNKLEHMTNNKKDFLPGIYGLNLKNLHDKSLEYAISSIGTPDLDNLCRFYDQRERLGLYHFDESDLDQSVRQLTTLSNKIVKRKQNQIIVSPNEYPVEQLAESILELYRFPLLITLSEKNSYNELSMFHRVFNGVIPNESCSVMFRLDNSVGSDFNEYIKINNLNNLVDKSTKIVYISSSKVPKPLLQADWHPSAAITTYSGYGAGKVDTLLDALDLVIHYDNESSPWKRNRIEKI